MASPVTSAWTATGPLTSRRPCTGSAASPRTAGIDLDVDRVLVALQVRLGLGALLLVGAQRLEAGVLTSSFCGVVAAGGEILRRRRRARRRSARSCRTGLRTCRRGRSRAPRGPIGRLVLRVAVEVADLGALLAAAASRPPAPRARAPPRSRRPRPRPPRPRRRRPSGSVAAVGRVGFGARARARRLVVTAAARDERGEHGEQQSGQCGRTNNHERTPSRTRVSRNHDGRCSA